MHGQAPRPVLPLSDYPSLTTLRRSVLLFFSKCYLSVLFGYCFPFCLSQLAGALRPPPAGFAAGRFSQKLPAARLKPLRQPASVGQSVSESVSQRKSEPVSQTASESVGESVGERKRVKE